MTFRRKCDVGMIRSVLKIFVFNSDVSIIKFFVDSLLSKKNHQNCSFVLQAVASITQCTAFFFNVCKVVKEEKTTNENEFEPSSFLFVCLAE